MCDHYLPTLLPGSGFQPLPLPEGLPVTSNDIIGSLNEHLLRVLKELRSKEQTLAEMEKDLERYQRKFAVIIHQQVYHSHLSIYLSIYHLSIYLSIYLPSIYLLSIYLSIYLCNLLSLQGVVYKEYHDGCERWEAEKIKLLEEKRELDARHEQDQIRIQELKVSEFLPLPLFSCSLSLSPSPPLPHFLLLSSSPLSPLLPSLSPIPLPFLPPSFICHLFPSTPSTSTRL